MLYDYEMLAAELVGYAGVITVGVSLPGVNAWVSTLAYAVDSVSRSLIFVSSERSRHVVMMKASHQCAGSIFRVGVTPAEGFGLQLQLLFDEVPDDEWWQAAEAFMQAKFSAARGPKEILDAWWASPDRRPYRLSLLSVWATDLQKYSDFGRDERLEVDPAGLWEKVIDLPPGKGH